MAHIYESNRHNFHALLVYSESQQIKGIRGRQLARAFPKRPAACPKVNVGSYAVVTVVTFIKLGMNITTRSLYP